jgi:hypothetical protein
MRTRTGGLERLIVQLAVKLICIDHRLQRHDREPRKKAREGPTYRIARMPQWFN